tara:strand:+ start:39 stop:455 length:417 start_codon:yes stop_codon:yes gene_type:complete
MVEINLNMYAEKVKAYKKLLAQKDKLVGQESKDGRNQFQIKLNELKKSIKGQPFKFKDVMNDTLKQEKQGKFDRGAEGKAKNAMRKKMAQAKDSSRGGGVHAGTQKDKANKLAQAATDDPEYKAMMKKKKVKTGPGGR